MAVSAGITGQLLATECSDTTSGNAPSGLGLWGAQDVRCQIRWAKLAQRIGQGGHAATAWGKGLELGQARQ